MSDANRKPPMDAAESETLRMRGNSLHGNRETLETPTLERSGTVRKGPRPNVGHARFQGVGRSHSTREAGEQSRAHGGGGVRGGKGIDQGKRHTNLTRAGHSRESVAWDCWAYEKQRSGIRTMRFTALLHHVNPELLRASYFELKR